MLAFLFLTNETRMRSACVSGVFAVAVLTVVAGYAEGAQRTFVSAVTSAGVYATAPGSQRWSFPWN